MNNIYNFSAGPAMLPKEIMLKAQNQLLNWNNLGVSILELSHRSTEFIYFFKKCIENLRYLLNIPKEYTILFCHGGARGQFSAIPMNLLNQQDTTDYICSGFWSQAAAKEAKKYCYVNVINIIQKKTCGNISLIPMKEWPIQNNSKYIHYCPNETIEGIAIEEEPIWFQNRKIIGDFSSTLLSKEINIKKYAMIYASAQKNVGVSGLTIVIIKKELLCLNNKFIPSILNYSTLYNSQSMFNTPATFSWYIAGLIFKWLINLGGVKSIEKKNNKKSSYLYHFIDHSKFYHNNIEKKYRSKMNVTFDLKNKELTNVFVKEAIEYKLLALKGHVARGGIRASLYNSMPFSGVKKLVKFMSLFEQKYH
ncbi:3-phosphoserine/phosphohydroxythreonine transaminase [Buchnera aphidicola (Thelaxes californica)]|uniref:Phosphoserine aminotransferase n=1 Tax=Buchnera aphidicola (Thelaxes californica) TaxID=1315998 RepID=A0A4D6YFB5_9GAMM|nr:3-phosphoserine/phosphohydroxythreonine transaminase [Buchnera aphidicola]QCI26773.1 3-phosphoserine/phosphohydroxythreonine transaminase [Buchnera aphidicola (Thelaxes californica)]